MSDCLCLRARKKAKHFLKCLLYQEELYIIVEAFQCCNDLTLPILSRVVLGYCYLKKIFVYSHVLCF